jgi:signal peptidase I
MKKILIFGSFCLLLVFVYGYLILKEFQSLPQETITGNSMNPTFVSGQTVRVLYDKNISYAPYDIITFRLQTRDEHFVKRLIAKENDTVLFTPEGNILINGKPARTDFLSGKEFSQNQSLQILLKQLEYYENRVPEGHALVLGDNRTESLDASSFGLIPTEYIDGKVFRSFLEYVLQKIK